MNDKKLERSQGRKSSGSKEYKVQKISSSNKKDQKLERAEDRKSRRSKEQKFSVVCDHKKICCFDHKKMAMKMAMKHTRLFKIGTIRRQGIMFIALLSF
jgi:hypothetical protein